MGNDTLFPNRKKQTTYSLILNIWGYSSAGRAPALHAGGQEFESLYLHHNDLSQFCKAKLMEGQTSRRFKVSKKLCQQAEEFD